MISEADLDGDKEINFTGTQSSYNLPSIFYIEISIAFSQSAILFRLLHQYSCPPLFILVHYLAPQNSRRFDLLFSQKTITEVVNFYIDGWGSLEVKNM